MESDDKTHFEEPPSFGLKLLLNHEFPLQSKQIISPSAKQVFELMPLTMRYLKYYMGKKMQNKRPIMDYVNLVSAQRMYGCPIGGIGAGTIGRGFKGEFCRFQLNPGIYEYVVNPYCQFIVNIRNAKNDTIFQSVLSTYQKPKKAPQSWEWNLNGADCEYTALYPRAWTTYDLSKYGIKLVCRQISPIIPHNYKDSSLPCAVFVWSVKNVSAEHRSVSITFTWSEVLPNKKKNHSKVDIERYSDEKTCGVSIEQKISDIPCTFTISKNKPENETIHEGYCSFNVSKNSSYVWECLKKTGKLEPFSNNMHGVVTSGADGDGNDKKKNKHNKSYRCDAVGLSSGMNLDPGGVSQTEFSLTWDMPIVQYKKDGHPYKRFYTKYFGSDGIAGASLSSYALKNYKKWEKQLTEWQDTILKNNNIPDWLKSALMNELYYVADGGTIWFDASDQYPESDPRHEFGLFGYLEGHEYRMYNTYDVHFYASFALAQLWPNLQVVLQYMFNDTITMESKKDRKSLYDGKKVKYKIKNSIPHDLGDPYDEPFTKINAYNIHDVSEWRDLNMKFILQVMRDYRLLKGHSAPFDNERYLELQYIDDIRDGLEDELYTRCVSLETTTPENKDFNGLKREVVVKNGGVPTGNILEMLYRNEEVSDEMSEEESGGDFSVEKVFSARQYLVDMYPSCAALVRRMCAWDTDGDGLPENTGTPDQTYDAWVMTGPSAYCGGLWLASLCVVKTIARLLNRLDDEKEFNDLLTKAKQSYEDKLWNGSYYKFDVKPSNGRVVMSDQLAGHWYLRASGLNESVFPEDNVKKALKVIYENNVLKFRDGKMGAVNGFVTEGLGGHVDRTAIQSEEMWTGVTYGLASLMIYEGMYDEAFQTAGGMYSTLTQMGLSFETPEALYENGNHRSIGYMRPLAVWSMLQAIVSRPPTRTQINNVS